MRVVVVNSVSACSPRPKANSSVVFPPPPTRDTRDRRPTPKEAVTPSKPITGGYYTTCATRATQRQYRQLSIDGCC